MDAGPVQGRPVLSGLRISGKVMLVSMATTAIAMTVIVGAFIYYDLQSLESNREHRINAQLDILSKNISAAMIFEDAVSAGELLGSLAADPSILAALVFTGDDVVFAEYHSRESDIGYPVVGGRSSGPGRYPGVALFSRDIVVDGTKIGTVTSWVSNREVTEGITRTLWYAGASFVLASLVAFFVSLVIQNTISGPIKHLNELSRRVTDTGDYKIRASLSSDDEVGELAQAFNSMLDYIDQRDTMLEKQVRQRTAELEKLAEEFRYRAFHDALTGLPNRSLLNEHFATAVAHAKRNQTRCSLLLLDLDNFKNINDTLGHDIGDELLKSVAARIFNVVRAGDLVCRLGGDEFVVLVGDVTAIAAIEVIAGHIIEALQQDVDIDDRSLKVTVSIGASLYPDHGTDLVTLKRNADIAMYKAKEAGRNQYKLFESSMAELRIW
ncbi:diguanylate cyclase [Exilibacterium tricleocarpae]|uniref:Diguanylate cyclase n=1 Tax=Exilibacterium tricleocarpae TaxID=2591008 RepID=A0A545TQI5_9GAMM|nr:sensor domain-containing diguanylate cyclase [Exilibacterium tricleocarpae]TQV79489.1 diguanylate cyclase [Exilibacterium tricleocarpae]